MTEVMTTRHRAAGILSAHKLRMIEAEGIVVVDKPRLEALERISVLAKECADYKAFAYPTGLWNSVLELREELQRLEAIDRGNA